MLKMPFSWARRGDLGDELLAARLRRISLVVLNLGAFLVTVNGTILNVALPALKGDLGVGDEQVLWVVNAYLVTFGGFLLLGGRLGDLLCPRRVFIAGLTVFTLASLVCGSVGSIGALVAGRSLQGLGGALASAAILTQITRLFTAADERAGAIGSYVFINAASGGIGLLLGGLLVNVLSWHWVFLINVPAGLLIIFLTVIFVPTVPLTGRGRLDVPGAVTVTMALMIAVYAVLQGGSAGWDARIWGLFVVSAVLIVAFFLIESRASSPLVPLGLFQNRNFVMATAIGVLFTSTILVWRTVSALHLQSVLHYGPIDVGLLFLGASGATALLSFTGPKVLRRFGIAWPIMTGGLLGTAGLLLFAIAPLEGNAVLQVCVGMLCMGAGAGLVYNPVFVAAINEMSAEHSGAASGVLNTSITMGGAFMLAALGSVAAMWTSNLLSAGVASSSALGGGYRAAFCAGAALAFASAVMSMTLRNGQARTRKTT
jgi:MFS family permease